MRYWGNRVCILLRFVRTHVRRRDWGVHVRDRRADHARYARVFHALLEQNVYFPPSGYEAIFPSLAHTDADIDTTIDAAVNAAIDAAGAQASC